MSSCYSHGICLLICTGPEMNLTYLLCIYLISLKEQTSPKRYELHQIMEYTYPQDLPLSYSLAQYARWLLENKYTTEADGLPGNDDYGTD